jgi:hypothetical protein
MGKITIKTPAGKQIEFIARKMEGAPPDGIGMVYVLLDSEGKQQPAAFDNLDLKNRQIGFFDCIEVVDSTAFAFRFFDRERVVEIGTLIT